MRKILFMAAAALVLAACGGKTSQSTSRADSTAVATDSVGNPAADFDLIAALDVESAAQFGLSFIYEDEFEPDDGDAGMYVAVYGRGVERGKKLDWGYELHATSDHACYFCYQSDTSQQTVLCFKSKEDADDFFEKALAYGLVENAGSYFIPEEKLPNGTIHAESLNDYNIYAEIGKPELDSELYRGFYVIRINYFA